MAKKKAKKKSAAKTTGPQKGAGALKFSAIHFVCDPQCQVSSGSAHIGPPGSKVALIAFGTDVTLTFTNGSPFAGSSTIEISADRAKVKTVKAGAPEDTYDYSFNCADCVSLLAPAEMIVP